MCCFKSIPASSVKLQHNPDELQWQRGCGKNQRKKIEEQERCCGKNRGQFNSLVAASKIERQKQKGGKRRPGEQEHIILKCEGSKGEEREHKQRRRRSRGVPRNKGRDGVHVLEALKRTRGILEIKSS